MIRLNVMRIKLFSLPFLLNTSLFLIFFALSSSIISVWFDNKRQDINAELLIAKQHQELFRHEYERLWDEFFNSENSKTMVSNYATAISQNKNIKQPNQLVCWYDHYKASQGHHTIISILNTGKQFLTLEQIKRFDIVKMESNSKILVAEAKNGFVSYCSNLNYKKYGQALDLISGNIQTLIMLARELKHSLEKNVMGQSTYLSKNYRNSNIAIFISFIFQLIVFTIVSVVDINTSVFRRQPK